MGIAQHLDLDMTWFLEELFQIECGIAESLLRLARGDHDGLCQLRGVMDHAHPRPPPRPMP
jgi:hypothetical protein